MAVKLSLNLILSGVSVTYIHTLGVKFSSMIYKLSILFILSISVVLSITAQDDDIEVIQFSGQIFHEEGSVMEALAYANIYVKGTNRGAVSDYDGFFSLPVRKNEVVVFKYLGFADLELTIPDTLSSDRYFAMIMMHEDHIEFDPVVILPWPSKEHFDIEFAAMDVTDEMRERANENLRESVMAELREHLNMDGQENFNQFLQQKQAEYYAAGQTRPMNILNVLAWKKFLDQIKRKKKK